MGDFKFTSDDLVDKVIELKAMLAKLLSEVIDAPMHIGGKEIRTDNKI